MTTPRKPTAAFWIVVAVVLLPPVVYVASFGPACWMSASIGPATDPPGWTTIYAPLANLADGHSFVSPALHWWMMFAVPVGGTAGVSNGDWMMRNWDLRRPPPQPAGSAND